jgi:bisphosphoglycerate-independent phosphoglycerate mutase (AlkP superfamily)
MNTMLMILDGFGINPDPNSSAIERAKKPFIDNFLKNIQIPLFQHLA